MSRSRFPALAVLLAAGCGASQWPVDPSVAEAGKPHGRLDMPEAEAQRLIVGSLGKFEKDGPPFTVQLETLGDKDRIKVPVERDRCYQLLIDIGDDYRADACTDEGFRPFATLPDGQRPALSDAYTDIFPDARETETYGRHALSWFGCSNEKKGDARIEIFFPSYECSKMRSERGGAYRAKGTLTLQLYTHRLTEQERQALMAGRERDYRQSAARSDELKAQRCAECAAERQSCLATEPASICQNRFQACFRNKGLAAGECN